jgi:hypothetical protein
MPENVAKLAIVVGTKGVKESTKELDALTKRVKELEKGLKSNKKTTKAAGEQQKKFTTTIGSLRSALPATASAIYLVQQAYAILKGALDTVNEAYEKQFSSEIQLQAILKTTSNAIGFTTEEIYKMTDAWSSMTGINDSILNEAAAIGATFVDISKEVFPDLIEQALNMSTIFKQDLKQSIIQLGVATNNLQVSRLTRIGISFTDQQKKQIRVLRESGDVLGAQILIMEELEREIGGVAQAMGESSLGAIRKYNTAWENLFEELGEASTTAYATILQNMNMSGVVKQVSDAIGTINATNKITTLFDAGVLAENVEMGLVSFAELGAAYKTYIKLVTAAENRAESALLPSAVASAEADAKVYTTLSIAVHNLTLRKKALEEQQKLDIAEAERLKKLKQEADAIALLAKQYEQYGKLKNRAELAGIDDKFEKQRRALEIEWLAIRKKAWEEHGLTVDQLNEKTGNYYATMLQLINVQEASAIAEQKIKDTDLYGSETRKNAEAYLLLVKDLERAVKGGLSQDDADNFLEQWVEDLHKAQLIFNDINAPRENKFMEGLIGGFDTAKERADLFAQSMENIGNIVEGLALDAIGASFYTIGDAIMRGSDATDDLGLSLLGMVGSAFEAASAQFLVAAATAFASKDYGTGATMLALAASTGIAGGVIGGALTQQDTATAKATVTDPLTATPPTDLGGSNKFGATDKTPINISILDSTGSSISAEESQNASGVKEISIIVDAAVNDGLGKGSYNDALVSGFDIQPVPLLTH